MASRKEGSDRTRTLLLQGVVAEPWALAAMIPVFDETPEFEKQVTVAAYEAAWMKRELDTLVSSSKAASKVRLQPAATATLSWRNSGCVLLHRRRSVPNARSTWLPCTMCRLLRPAWKCSVGSWCVSSQAPTRLPVLLSPKVPFWRQLTPDVASDRASSPRRARTATLRLRLSLLTSCAASGAGPRQSCRRQSWLLWV